MVRMAHFWSLIKRPGLEPQVSIPYDKCGRIKELYNIFKIDWGKNLLSLVSVKIVRDTLLATLFMCGLQVMCSSKTIPRMFNCFTSPLLKEPLN